MAIDVNLYAFQCDGCLGRFRGRMGQSLCDVCEALEADDAENDAAQACEDEDNSSEINS